MARRGFGFFKPNFETEKTWCHKFITEFDDDKYSTHGEYQRRKYLIELVNFHIFDKL